MINLDDSLLSNQILKRTLSVRKVVGISIPFSLLFNFILIFEYRINVGLFGGSEFMYPGIVKQAFVYQFFYFIRVLLNYAQCINFVLRFPELFDVLPLSQALFPELSLSTCLC